MISPNLSAERNREIIKHFGSMIFEIKLTNMNGNSLSSKPAAFGPITGLNNALNKLVSLNSQEDNYICCGPEGGIYLIDEQGDIVVPHDFYGLFPNKVTA